jgi:hypothetical protein
VIKGNSKVCTSQGGAKEDDWLYDMSIGGCIPQEENLESLEGWDQEVNPKKS